MTLTIEITKLFCLASASAFGIFTMYVMIKRLLIPQLKRKGLV